MFLQDILNFNRAYENAASWQVFRWGRWIEIMHKISDYIAQKIHFYHNTDQNACFVLFNYKFLQALSNISRRYESKYLQVPHLRVCLTLRTK